MPQNYTGNTAGLSGLPAVTISEPVGTDVRNSQSVRTPLEKLADLLAYAMGGVFASPVTLPLANSATSAAGLTVRKIGGRVFLTGKVGTVKFSVADYAIPDTTAAFATLPAGYVPASERYVAAQISGNNGSQWLGPGTIRIATDGRVYIATATYTGNNNSWGASIDGCSFDL